MVKRIPSSISSISVEINGSQELAVAIVFKTSNFSLDFLPVLFIEPIGLCLCMATSYYQLLGRLGIRIGSMDPFTCRMHLQQTCR